MANKRMITRDVVGSDSFVSMPHSAQALFTQLTIDGDEAGFIGTPERIIRGAGCTREDLETLVKHGFVIQFESGVIVMKHWHVANKFKNDRTPTTFAKEYALLEKDENNVYQMIPDRFQNSSKVVPDRFQNHPNLTEPNLTELNRTEPNRTKEKRRELNRGEESTRDGDGGDDGKRLLTEEEYH